MLDLSFGQKRLEPGIAGSAATLLPILSDVDIAIADQGAVELLDGLVTLRLGTVAHDGAALGVAGVVLYDLAQKNTLPAPRM